MTTTGLLSVLSQDMSKQYENQRFHEEGLAIPSMHVKNCATIRLSISLCALSRFGVIASISSINRRHGASFYRFLNCVVRVGETGLTFASSNVSRNVFSDSPDIPDTMDGADMLMKGTPSSCEMINRYNKERRGTHPSYRVGQHGFPATRGSM